ncbi:MAG: hypothetical protein OJF62_002303 [Pseudolabrys sp.]|jgi:hypothetical protein|nr:hypothetical protein [Pseudolabrys sp.]
MSLAGKGVVAIWNDIALEGRAEFYEWHDREHMPERAGIPGFLRGRRYIAVHGSPQYFTLYETETQAVLTGKDYLTRLNNPTPWTAKVVPAHFRNTSRGVCSVELSDGVGQGGYILTLRFGPQAGRENDLRQYLASVLPGILARPAVVGVHLCIADREGSSIETAEKRGREVGIPNWLVMIESVTPEAADAACKTLMAEMPSKGAAPGMDTGLYSLQFTRNNTAAR